MFSIAAVLFLPPGLVGTIYSKNFERMPELHRTIGYPFALGLMVPSPSAPRSAFGGHRRRPPRPSVRRGCPVLCCPSPAPRPAGRPGATCPTGRRSAACAGLWRARPRSVARPPFCPSAGGHPGRWSPSAGPSSVPPSVAPSWR
ncbi:CorA family divalent cation transporter [Siccirubricoccus soli]|uniref:CorA family divalent cation transporter n=1 Tax=Siccirubricoccus soli TaxID=2899147 RepID=UPI003516C6C9